MVQSLKLLIKVSFRNVCLPHSFSSQQISFCMYPSRALCLCDPRCCGPGVQAASICRLGLRLGWCINHSLFQEPCRVQDRLTTKVEWVCARSVISEATGSTLHVSEIPTCCDTSFLEIGSCELSADPFVQCTEPLRL